MKITEQEVKIGENNYIFSVIYTSSENNSEINKIFSLAVKIITVKAVKRVVNKLLKAHLPGSPPSSTV